MAKGINKLQKDNNNTLPPERKDNSISRHAFLLSAIVVFTFIVLRSCLDNTISVWDDTQYIAENSLVKNLSLQGLKNIFTTQVMGNYHPLTILSYALEYHFVGMEPWLYHFDNLLLHIIATLLVYRVTFLLSRSMAAAGITAVLFAIHPMHIESVAWVSARKDMLYAIFYLSACAAYINYIKAPAQQLNGRYIALVVFFVCALLSKPVAVSLPVVLLLIDYYCKRPFTRAVLLEKLPLFVLSLVFGIMAISVQQKAGAMSMLGTGYNFIEKVTVAGYALLTYLGKAILPVNIHANYYYPKKVDGALPVLYYIGPLMVLALTFIVWNILKQNRAVIFGLLFFVSNIALVLQLIPVGDSMLAERYTYVPYIGLFFIAGLYIGPFFEHMSTRKYGAYVVSLVVVYIGALSYTSANQCGVWYDNISLWGNEIKKEPANSVKGYNNLGFNYYFKWMGTGNTYLKDKYADSVYYCMHKVMELAPDMANPYVMLGELEVNAGKDNEAIATLHKGLAVDPKESNLYTGLASIYYKLNKFDSCAYYFRAAIKVKPSAEAHGNYAILLATMDRNDSALHEYDIAVKMNPNNPSHFLNRGKLHIKQGRWPEATTDLDKAIQINPDMPEPYYQRSFCDTQQKNFSKALRDVDKSISLGFMYVDRKYYRSLIR